MERGETGNNGAGNAGNARARHRHLGAAPAPRPARAHGQIPGTAFPQLFHSFSTAFPASSSRPSGAGLCIPGSRRGRGTAQPPKVPGDGEGGTGRTRRDGVRRRSRHLPLQGQLRCCPHSQPCAPGDPDPTLPSAGPAAAAQTLLRLLLRAERGELEPPGCGNAGMRGAGSGVGA